MIKHDPEHAYWCAVPECPRYVRKQLDPADSAEALREAAGLLANACRRYFEGEAKAVVNIQPLVEKIERILQASAPSPLAAEDD